MATERFAFGTWDDGIIKVPQVLFGCADPSTSSGGQIADDPRFNGIFGLSDVSFLPNIGVLITPYSQLQIGTGVELEGTPTSLKVKESGTFSIVVDSIKFMRLNSMAV
ncbi:hypothetical protein TIFTF001_013331 [Ficus carica]|uniref:Uncharacterized protein n=1 Tax=Ficus carica TaxID=3494 RepID=A0AA88D749_FICCA|nr:hypothetical protein TIFTF001_013331 [Ficus carica]